MGDLADNDGDDARVTLDISEGVARITMVRTARLNAFDQAMHAALRDALVRVMADSSVRVLVLAGSGRAFCAGQDLGERAAAFHRGEQPDLRGSLEENYNPLVRTLTNLPVPVIAEVGGIAFGAGAALAIACDIVVAAEDARFQFGFVNVGLGPDSGSSWFLPRLVGQVRALDLALTGRPVVAGEALAMGLISRVVAAAEMSGLVSEIAAGLAAISPDAVTAIKRQLRANPLGSLDAALDAERDAQASLGQTDAYRAAVLRFATK